VALSAPIAEQPPPSFPPAPTNDSWVHHQPPGQPAYWHHPHTGASAWTLPPGAHTACGWAQELQVDTEPLWRHLESGALCTAPPPAGEQERHAVTAGASERSAIYAHGHSPGDEWVRADSESGWRQLSTGATASELPDGARTACGWWRLDSLGMWLHVGSGATSKHPPSLRSQDAAALIRAHLRAMEAARSLR
jgi:hypothetical protein